jgi:hypothetical protein
MSSLQDWQLTTTILAEKFADCFADTAIIAWLAVTVTVPCCVVLLIISM